MRANPLVVFGLAVLVITAPLRLSAQESLAAARQLYASADYAGALTMLNALLGTNPSGEERQSIDLYRALCLVAVGNAAEASRAIETILTRDPLYRPNTDEVPPRLRSAFTDARKRLLPSIIQQKYVAAKTAFDQKDMVAAADGFKQVLSGLSDPDIAPAVEQPPLSDLRVLATGFYDLASKSLPPPAPSPAANPTPAAPAAQTPVERPTPRIYSAADKNVVPPVVIRQLMPPFPGRVIIGSLAVIDVVVDEMGAVEAATLETGINPQYNRTVLAAARDWRYRPATLDGVPVKFRKRVQVSLGPNAPIR